jgi:hypothetical protein
MRIESFLMVCLLPAGVLCGCGESDSAAAASTAAPTSRPAAAAAAVAGPATASSPGGATPAAAPPLPVEIVAFRKRRGECDHFRGEEAYDARRAAFLAAEVRRTCAGTDRALADLRRRHARDARALAALKDYEDRIE